MVTYCSSQCCCCRGAHPVSEELMPLLQQVQPTGTDVPLYMPMLPDCYSSTESENYLSLQQQSPCQHVVYSIFTKAECCGCIGLQLFLNAPASLVCYVSHVVHVVFQQGVQTEVTLNVFSDCVVAHTLILLFVSIHSAFMASMDNQHFPVGVISETYGVNQRCYEQSSCLAMRKLRDQQKICHLIAA